MNFFKQQDLARRNTNLLILLFLLAVCSLVILTNLLVMLSFGLFQGQASFLPWELSLSISLVVITIIGLAIVAKWQQLKLGGRTIAQSLGGERVSADSQDPLHRRLLNVVEEMAVAANLPVPPVYLLPERGINAFAAGYSPADAVIGVTQGCIEQLNRDELQGVVAHEFSHILNGDMRMNIRLIAILNGILFIGHIGYYLLRASRGSQLVRSSRKRDDSAGALFLLGLGLVIIGYLGSFFGNLIKAAVSRQREYLADASAVQFSRNSRGIAGALKRIGGYQAGTHISHGNADEVSHLFFGEAISRWAAIFATHPPLEKRIRRLDPSWNGRFSKTPTVATVSPAQSKDLPEEQQRRAMLAAIPMLLTQSSHQRLSAQAIVCVMLLESPTTAVAADNNFATQLTHIKAYGSHALLSEVDQLTDAILRLPLAQQVQLLQMSIPALKQLTESEFQQFDQLLQQLIGPMPTFKQWLCISFIEHVVASEYDAKQVIRTFNQQKLTDLLPALLPFLSAVADCAGHAQATQTAWLTILTSLNLPSDLPKPVVNFSELNMALLPLLQASPRNKEKIWQTILSAMKVDQHFTNEEQGLVNFLALLLEMPVPHLDMF
ncbi:M48 family metallopeptidase [Alishewanella sp. d11]|uniref:M48 family metallopeptidase n=1 Tax=Alishewanella sp. d11 TaxID=3414030 RepID=UPI003BF77F40